MTRSVCECYLEFRLDKDRHPQQCLTSSTRPCMLHGRSCIRSNNYMSILDHAYLLHLAINVTLFVLEPSKMFLCRTMSCTIVCVCKLVDNISSIATGILG